MATGFETKTCGRCGGSGHYSYCQRFGTVCFGCGGNGKEYTKRGKAAREYYQSLLPAKAAKDLVAGDRFYHHPTWLEVIALGPSTCHRIVNGQPVDDGYINIECKGILVAGVSPEHVYRVAPTAEQKAEAVAKAMAYQASLTALGKPAKRTRRPQEV